MNSNVFCINVFLISAFFQLAHNLDYSDLEVLGIYCPNLAQRYKCRRYAHPLPYEERGCECDAACNYFKDCCINAPRRRIGRLPSSTANDVSCVSVGENKDGGVYAIATCRNDWRGSRQIRQKCEGPDDFSDPLNAAPVTSIFEARTYRNRYCAECNDANMATLKTFQLKLSCPGLSPFLTEEQTYADLRYDDQLHLWGIDRLNDTGNSTYFSTCDLIFDVPEYFSNSIRFCSSNIISSCPPQYSRYYIRNACEEYMAIVYDDKQGYRNPHCAICNGKTVREIHCKNELDSRKRQMSFALLLDINTSDGDKVGKKLVPTPECPSNHKYDPYFKKCRKLVCALPGFDIVNGKCVRQT